MARGEIIANPIINFIFPPVCAVCAEKLSQPDTPVCPACWDNLEPDDMDPVDPSAKDFAFTEIRSIWKFSEAFQKIIHFLKYDHKQSVGRKIGTLLAERIPTDYFQNTDCLVPVPVHHTRKRERGYNQAEIIGKSLAERIGLPLEAKTLTRLKKTMTQTKLSKGSRRENMSGVFTVRNGHLRGKRVMIVDDVFTTGATVNECAQALLASGAEAVKVVTAARA